MRYATVARTVIVAASIILGVGIAYYWRAPRKLSPIQPFEYTRDAAQVTELFRQDYNWLSTRVFDPAHIDWVLRTHSPNEYEPEYEGRMSIDVLRDKGSVAGFVTYYVSSPFIGTILFLEVGKDFRSKGYGEKLVRHAIDELFLKGVSVVKLLTRTTNFPAQRLYNRVGFQETSRDADFVYFVVTPQTLVPVSTSSDPAMNLARRGYASLLCLNS